jgi:two-component system CheB/CheR fusion protein
LEAFRALLKALSADTGFAYIFVQHLDPTHESLVAELLSKHTAMPVREVTDQEDVQRNCVYVIPPNRYVEVFGGRLVLSEPTETRGTRMAVDVLLSSLAEQYGRNGVGIVLSGSGSDGARGLRAVRAAGGLTIVQKPETAAHNGMPRSAIDQGVVDLVLDIADIPATLRRYATHPYALGQMSAAHASERRERETDARRVVEPEAEAEFDKEPLEAIIRLLRERQDTDMGSYKRSTLVRRVQRRMGLKHVYQPAEYLGVLRSDPDELAELAGDMHINVTDFFRDPEAFEILEREALAPLLLRVRERERSERTLRVWVPGCATGEEAYSIAMACLDIQAQQRGSEDHRDDVHIQIFATDVDSAAIRVARTGVYSQSGLGALSPERCGRFLEQVDDQSNYRVRQFVRDRVSFARHNLLSDPPFSRIDLISCRNLLIYLQRDAQEHALQYFHFALRPQGFLFLGPSEALGTYGELFRTINKKWRLFQRLEISHARRASMPLFAPHSEKRAMALLPSIKDAPLTGAAPSTPDLAQRLIARELGPPSVLVNEQFRVLYLHGDLIEFLDLPSGAAEMTLLDMLRQDVRSRVRAAVYKAAREQQPVVTSGALTARDGTSMRYEAQVRPCSSRELGDGLLLLSFTLEPADQAASVTPSNDESVNLGLERELQATREDLRSTVEELENANEELRSSNEEAMTMNEELQSTNEELETQSEELRSVNEELISVNTQLREKMEEVQEAHADIANLLTSTKLPAIFLDRAFCIRRYTPEARKLLNVIESDVGRPLHDLAGACIGDGMLEDAKAVIDGLSPVEKEIQDDSGEWYLRRILPYRTDDDRIAGVVVTFSAVTRLKLLTAALARQREQQERVTTVGLRALRDQNFARLAGFATKSIAETLGCEMCKVLQYQPEEQNLRLIAGVGWAPGLVGSATVSAGMESQAGYTLEQSGPIVVKDMATETRFNGPQLLHDHGVVSGMSCVILGRDGKPFGVLGVHTTLSREFDSHEVDFLQQMANVLAGTLQRLAVEEELRANEQRFRALADNMSQLAWMADETGSVFWYNRRWFEYTGTTLAQMRGWGWQAVQDPEMVNSVTTKFRQHVELGEEWEDTFPLKGADGRYRWFLSRAMPIRDAGGRVSLWFGTNTDITELRDAEAALEEGRRKLQAIIDNAPAAIYAKDREGRYVFCNRRVASVVGLDPHDMVGHTDLELDIQRSTTDEYRSNDERVWKSGEPLEVEERIGSGDEQRVFISLKFPLWGADGKMTAVCGISTDISDRIEDERHLRTVMAELNHRVKNTLATIDSIARQTSSRAGSLEEFRSSFGARLQSMGAAHSLLTRRDWRGADLGAIIRTELQPRVGDASQLTLDGPQVLLRPKVALAMHMAIHELATNAAKYGSLSTPGGSISIQWQREGDSIAMTWTEQGGPPTPLALEEGFGSRMIEQLIIYELSGSFERDCGPQGLVARIRVPLSGGAGGAGVVRSDNEEGEASGRRVLVVEDNSYLADELTSHLRRNGYDIIGPVSTLQDALDVTEHVTPDAALLDIDLDGERVYPVAERLLQRSVPFVFVTGYDAADLPPSLEGSDYLPKPLDIDRIEQWLERTFGETHQPEAHA